jgi:hypothetical protein
MSTPSPNSPAPSLSTPHWILVCCLVALVVAIGVSLLFTVGPFKPSEHTGTILIDGKTGCPITVSPWFDGSPNGPVPVLDKFSASFGTNVSVALPTGQYVVEYTCATPFTSSGNVVDVLPGQTVTAEWTSASPGS